MKKWSYIHIICFLFILGITTTTIKANEMSSVSNDFKELIVLVDSSGTMQGEKWENAIEWMKTICALGNTPEIKIQFVCFDDPINQQPDSEKVVDGSGKQMSMEQLDILKEEKPVGKTTDLSSAMNWAITHMEDSSATDKCIVMLSDAQLDLKGRTKEEGEKENKYNLKPDEEESMENFKDAVQAFDKEKNQFIVLVEFDKNESEMCINGEPRCIFKELRDDAGVMYFNWEEERQEAILKIFKKLNYPISISPKEDCEDNEINFEITKNLYRIIINLYNKTQEIDETQINNLEIVCIDDNTKEEISIKIDDRLISSTSAFLYFEEPRYGDYTIKLPSGQWQCSRIEQTNVKIGDIELAVIQDDESIKKEKNDTQTEDYSVFNIVNKAFRIKFELDSATQENEYNYSDLACFYYIDSVSEMNDSKLNIDETKFVSINHFRDEKDKYSYIEITQLGQNQREGKEIEAGCYVFKLKICSGKEEHYSHPIWLQIEEQPGIRLEPIEGKVNKEIKLRDLVNEQQANELRVIYIYDSDEKHIGEFTMDGEQTGGIDIFSIESDTVTFLKAGEYELRMEGENIQIYQDIIVENEKVSENPSWFEEIIECIKKFFEGF